MIRVITLAAFIWIIANAQDVPPPPKPSGQTDSPSLESTMKFVQDKLNAEGNVTYVATRHDANTNQVLGSTTSSFEVSGAAADPKTCTLSYAKLNLTFAPTKYESRARLPFRGVQKLEVSNVEDRSKQNAAAQGHPELSFTVVPSTYEIVVSMASQNKVQIHSIRSQDDKVLSETDGEFFVEVFYFKSEDLAHRVAKAMVHAVELCGGGSNDPF